MPNDPMIILDFQFAWTNANDIGEKLFDSKLRSIPMEDNGYLLPFVVYDRARVSRYIYIYSQLLSFLISHSPIVITFSTID